MKFIGNLGMVIGIIAILYVLGWASEHLYLGVILGGLMVLVSMVAIGIALWEVMRERSNYGPKK